MSGLFDGLPRRFWKPAGILLAAALAVCAVRAGSPSADHDRPADRDQQTQELPLPIAESRDFFGPTTTNVRLSPNTLPSPSTGTLSAPANALGHGRFSHVHVSLGRTCLERNNVAGAVEQFRHAVDLSPSDPLCRQLLALALVESGEVDAGLVEFREAMALGPQEERAHRNFALALLRSGSDEQALSVYRQALRRWPTSTFLMNNVAWILATHPDERLRDGEASLQLAERAIDANPSDLDLFDTLAAAHAELGRWSQALQVVDRGLETAVATGARGLAARFASRKELYSQHLPLRESPAESNGTRPVPQDVDPLPGVVTRLIEGVESPVLRTAADRLAWVLATHPNTQLRDGRWALRLSQALADATGRQDMNAMRTLAAAQAESGRWSDAIATLRSALQWAEQSGKLDHLVSLRAALAECESRSPIRDATLGNPIDIGRATNAVARWLRCSIAWATSLVAVGEVDAAIEVMRQAALSDPVNAQVQHLLADLLRRRGEHGLAAFHLLAALHVQVDEPRLHEQLANELASLGRSSAAIEHFRIALKLDPDLRPAWSNLGLLLVQGGQAAEAIDHYQAALDRWPDWNDAANNLAWLLATYPNGKYRDASRAIRLMESACERGSSADPTLLDTLAAAYAEAGKFELAEQYAAQAIELFRSAGSLDDAEQAEQHLELYRSRRPCRTSTAVAAPSDPSTAEQAATRRFAGVELVRQGRIDLALVQFAEAVRLEGNRLGNFTNLALTLARAGHAREAVDCYRDALRRWPDQVVVANDLAWLLATNPDKEIRNGGEAVRILEGWCQAPNEPDAELLDTLSAAYAEAGDFGRAIETIQRAIGMLRDESTARSSNSERGQSDDRKPSATAEIAARLRAHLQRYEQGLPIRDDGQTSAEGNSP